MKVYDGFADWEDVVNQFTGRWGSDEILEENKAHYKEPSEVVLAVYETDNNWPGGAAFVVFRRGRKWYLVTGSHCSCYGLEESGFQPEEFATKTLFKQWLENVNYLYGLNTEQYNYIRGRFGLKPVSIA